MADSTKSAGSTRVYAGVVAAIVAAAAIAGGVYVMQTGSGNDEAVASACTGSAERVAGLEGLNVGEVAAFQIAEQPEPVGELSFNDENGEPTGIEDHAGSTVLLNLWATWCAPCREEMPELDELQHVLGGDDFIVLPVSVDLGDAEKPKAFYEETGLQYLPFRHDGTIGVFNELKRRGYAFGMPTTLLIDRDGCVLGALNGPAAWASEDAQRLVRAVIGK